MKAWEQLPYPLLSLHLHPLDCYFSLHFCTLALPVTFPAAQHQGCLCWCLLQPVKSRFTVTITGQDVSWVKLPCSHQYCSSHPHDTKLAVKSLSSLTEVTNFLQPFSSFLPPNVLATKNRLRGCFIMNTALKGETAKTLQSVPETPSAIHYSI